MMSVSHWNTRSADSWVPTVSIRKMVAIFRISLDAAEVRPRDGAALAEEIADHEHGDERRGLRHYKYDSHHRYGREEQPFEARYSSGRRHLDLALSSW